MSRHLNVAAAQLGPVHLADDRSSVVKRLIAMLREADARGCKLVVFTELALTTFFPRYWMEDPAEIDAFFEEEIPNDATRPLFDEAKRLGIGFYLGYAELARENGNTHHYNTAILVGPEGNIVGKYRKVHLPGHADNRPDATYQHLEKKYFKMLISGIAMLREAGARGCKLVVFTELALTTFFPRYWMEDPAEIDAFFEEEIPNDATRPLFDEAKRLGIGFYLGYAELARENGNTHHYNTAILVGPEGNIVGKYRKVHLPGHADNRPDATYQHLEKKYFEIGNLGFPVWRMYDHIVGMCICNDRRWPETYRVMGLKGVDLVMLGYNTPDSNAYHPEPVHLKMFHNLLSMQAGAYQNGTWVVAAAKAGAEDGYGLIGGSCIIAPTGEIVAQALTEEDEVISYNCDLDLGQYIKKTIFDFDAHRRIEHYGLITEQTGVIPQPED